MNCCTGCIHRASLQCTVEQLPVKQETGFQNNNSPHQLLAPKQTTVEQTAVKQTAAKQKAVKQTAVKQTAVKQKAPKQTTVEQTAPRQTALEQTAVEETSVKLKTLFSCLRSNNSGAGDPMSTSAKS